MCTPESEAQHPQTGRETPARRGLDAHGGPYPLHGWAAALRSCRAIAARTCSGTVTPGAATGVAVAAASGSANQMYRHGPWSAVGPRPAGEVLGQANRATGTGAPTPLAHPRRRPEPRGRGSRVGWTHPWHSLCPEFCCLLRHRTGPGSPTQAGRGMWVRHTWHLPTHGAGRAQICVRRACRRRRHTAPCPPRQEYQRPHEDIPAYLEAVCVARRAAAGQLAAGKRCSLRRHQRGPYARRGACWLVLPHCASGRPMRLDHRPDRIWRT